MQTRGQTGLWVLLGIIVVILIGVIIWKSLPSSSAPSTGSNGQSMQALFLCADDKTIDAAFASSSVGLTLSDGRTFTLPQTISGSGARYADTDESFVFWNKGNTAFIQEGNSQTYVNCIETVGDPGGLPEAYADRTFAFTLRYAEGYSINPSYVYQGLGIGKDIHGVSFTIPTSMATGTNLGSDTYFAVEELDSSTACSASDFLSDRVTPIAMTQNDSEYSVASSTGAGAGNRYEEWVYAIPGTNPCTALRYFIHYSVLENYPAGAVKAFDEAALLAQFDAMRKTLILGR